MEDIADLVIKDMQQRKLVGIQRYGKPLRAFNGRDGLLDLYEELMDACQYIRQLMAERTTDNEGGYPDW